MKKTIAILLVLVLAGVGLFAVGEDLTTGNGTAKLIFSTTIAPSVIFGVSEGAISTFTSSSVFSALVDSSYSSVITLANLATSGGYTVGYISGFNNTKTAVSIAVSSTNLALITTAAVEGVGEVLSTTAIIPIDITAPASHATVTIPAADGTTNPGAPGTLSTEFKVVATQADIDLAAAGEYKATITFTATAI